MYDDDRDLRLDPEISWLEVLAGVGLVAICLWGFGYIALKLTGLL